MTMTVAITATAEATSIARATIGVTSGFVTSSVAVRTNAVQATLSSAKSHFSQN